MRPFSFKFALPIMQLLLAVFLFVYAQHQFNAGVFGGELRFADRYPPLADRISRSINFPTEVVMAPLDRISVLQGTNWLFHIQPGWQVVIVPRDIIWLMLIPVFWYFLGSDVQSRRNGNVPATGMVIPVIGAILGIGCWLVATPMMKSNELYRQIGYSGMIWGSVLLLYFVPQVSKILSSRIATTNR